MMLSSLCYARDFLAPRAVRNPSANRSLIAFAAWSSFAHAAVMAIQAFQSAGDRRHLLLAVAILVVIAVPLIVLAPGKQSVERPSAAGA